MVGPITALVDVCRYAATWLPLLGLSPEVTTALVAAAVTLSAIVLVFRSRLLTPLESPPTAIAFKSGGSRAWVVVCRHCGTRNECGFRYCRNCTHRLGEPVVLSDATTAEGGE